MHSIKTRVLFYMVPLLDPASPEALMEIVNEGRGDASATEPALTERGQSSPSSPASGADGRPIDRFAPDLTALAKDSMC